jgi:predicted secreted hydrolase
MKGVTQGSGFHLFGYAFDSSRTKEKIKMSTLSYNVTEPALRSPIEEWQPHAKQSETTTEWWYVTAVVHDTAGNPYFLVWCPFHFAGEKTSPASSGLRYDQRAIVALTGFTDYRNNFHIGASPAAVVNEADTWEPQTNTLRFVAGDYSSEWSYQGDTMDLTVTSPQISYDLRITGTKQVMYAEDKLGIKGFIQEGAQDDRSYYYSLPRVDIAGRITYIGKGAVRRDIDVAGQGWVDRQWGDFLTKSWEWSSLRFSNGARVNLYNFANGYQVATYQKADGSTQWFDSFLVRQNGYLRTPQQGVWLSWGWSYEFPVEVEGSRRYTLEPFSKLDVYENPNNIFFEGPSRLVNDDTGEMIGVAVSESMDVRIMQNAPYAAHQH